jgi:hypothetical protein
MPDEPPIILSESVVPVPPPLAHAHNTSAVFMCAAVRVVRGLWHFAVGVLLSQSLLLSFLVVGWLHRFMQGVVYRRWWKTSPARRNGLSLEQFLKESEAVRSHSQAPSYFLADEFRAAYRSRGARAIFSSLVINAVIGVQAIFNTWVLTLPGCAMMLFSWGFGWNNSFTKGYELAPIGPATGGLGIALLIAAMLYLPMAQAHQAATGSWRAFYQWRIVWRIARHRWLASLFMAGVYSASSLLITVARVRPYFLGQSSRSTTAAQVESELAAYFLGAGIIVIGGCLLVRWLAARIYAGGVLRAISAGDIPVYALAAAQHDALEKLGYLHGSPVAARDSIFDLASRVASLAARFAAGFAFVFVWFSFVAQIYIAQFLNYIPVFGWLNQPLVQLPWIKFVPGKTNDELWGLLIVGIIALSVAVVKSAWSQLSRRKVPTTVSAKA